jgi:hypothetical protein
MQTAVHIQNPGLSELWTQSACLEQVGFGESWRVRIECSAQCPLRCWALSGQQDCPQAMHSLTLASTCLTFLPLQGLWLLHHVSTVQTETLGAVAWLPHGKSSVT